MYYVCYHSNITIVAIPITTLTQQHNMWYNYLHHTLFNLYKSEHYSKDYCWQYDWIDDVKTLIFIFSCHANTRACRSGLSPQLHQINNMMNVKLLMFSFSFLLISINLVFSLRELFVIRSISSDNKSSHNSIGWKLR